ncbi:MAG: PTS fructose transporter subunit IIA [Rhodanobacter denitrificans]|uniref:PTS fructose transporter subunit IIA n=1 Tax=Rhodanobacter denitrificans TaxID=666685 RepID=A0A2W5N0E0_9GAMM|nr:MAG: PTS fructose transporter subunit IIA [Rhodanobacter denitrificans]
MPLLDLLPAERVHVGVRAGDKPQLIRHLAGMLAVDDGELPAILESLLAREQLGSTGLGSGVAIPHGRTPDIDGARAAFVRLAEPVDFGAADGRPVDLVAALAVPAHFTNQHLQLLAELAQIFSDARLTDQLRDARDAATLRLKLAEWTRAARESR